MAYIIISKYQYNLPLYRLEHRFKQMGVELSRQTMASWVVQSAKVLEPMVRRLQAILLAQSVVYADGTPLKVIHEDKAQ